MKTGRNQLRYTIQQLSNGKMIGNAFIAHRSSFIIVLCTLIFFLGKINLAQAQTYPVTASVQIIPPYSVYLADYAVPGSDKLRVVLLQNDLTVASYDVRLQMTIELNGTVIMRTSPSFTPRPIALSPGVPTIVGGSDLYDYLNSANIDFSGGYSRETYERTKALPEGAYKITFKAYDYRRKEVQVSNEGSNIFFFQKNNPPVLNLPMCASRVEKRDPQFLIFSWSNLNTPSFQPGSEPEYIFSLYEIKPKNSNPDYIVRSAKPIYTITTESNNIIYGPGEPLLIDSMDYVWIVQARSKDGRDMYAGNGYSRSCTFSYLGLNPFEVNNINKPKLYGEAKTDRTAKLWWPLASTNSRYKVESYHVQHRGAKKDGEEYPWHDEEFVRDSTLTLYSLEPGRTYEARLQWRVDGVYGPWSDIVPFTMQPVKQVACGESPAEIKLPTNSQPLASAVAGMTVKIGLYDILLTKVSGGNGTYSGQGRVVSNGFGKGLLMQFNNVFINSDLVVLKGDMYAVTQKIEKVVDEATTRQRQVDAFKQFAGNVPDASAPLPQLKEFAKALVELPQDRIEDALALTKEEKQQVLAARETATAAMKVLDNPNATEEQKTQAEQKLRGAIASAKPALDKLARTLGQGVQAVVGDWFKNIRSFLNGYKGTASDQQQATYWHAQADSAVAAIRKRTDLPDSLMQKLNKAHDAAMPAWKALEKGSADIVAYNSVKHGPYANDEFWDALGTAQEKVHDLVNVIEQDNNWKFVPGQFYFDPSGHLISLGDDIKSIVNPTAQIVAKQKVNGLIYGFVTNDNTVYEALIEDNLFNGYYNNNGQRYECKVNGDVPANIQLLGVFFDGKCYNNYYSFKVPADLSTIRAPFSDQATPEAASFPFDMKDAAYYNKAKVNGLNCDDERTSDLALPLNAEEGSLLVFNTTKKELVNTPLFGKSVDVPKDAELLFVSVIDKQINKPIWILYSFEYLGQKYVWDDKKSWYYNQSGIAADNSFATTVTNAAGALGGFFVTSTVNAIENGNPFYQFKEDYKNYDGSIAGYTAKIFKDGVASLVSDVAEGGYKRNEALVSIFVVSGSTARLGEFLAPAMTQVSTAALKAGCRIVGNKTVAGAATVYYLNLGIATFENDVLQLTTMINGAKVSELAVIDNVKYETIDRIIRNGTVRLVKDGEGNVGWAIAGYTNETFENFASLLSGKGYNALKNKFNALSDLEKVRFMNNFSEAPDNVVAALNNTSRDLFAKWQNGSIKGNPDGFDRYYYETKTALAHSDIGDFANPSNPYNSLESGKMLRGGHGQKNIDYLNSIGRKYNIEYTFENGVRTGNVDGHDLSSKRTGIGQSWFPENWTTDDIEKAANYVMQKKVSEFSKLPDGVPLFDDYKGVRVGVIKTDGKWATVFPDNAMQPNSTGIYITNPKK